MFMRSKLNKNEKGIRWSAYLWHAMPDPQEHIRPNTFLKYHAVYRFLLYLSMVKNHFETQIILVSRSGFGSSPKSNQFFLVTHPTCPPSFIRIRPQLHMNWKDLWIILTCLFFQFKCEQWNASFGSLPSCQRCTMLLLCNHNAQQVSNSTFSPSDEQHINNW